MNKMPNQKHKNAYTKTHVRAYTTKQIRTNVTYEKNTHNHTLV